MTDNIIDIETAKRAQRRDALQALSRLWPALTSGAIKPEEIADAALDAMSSRQLGRYLADKTTSLTDEEWEAFDAEANIYRAN